MVKYIMSKDYNSILENFLYDLLHDDKHELMVNDTIYDCKDLNDAIILKFMFKKFIESK